MRLRLHRATRVAGARTAFALLCLAATAGDANAQHGYYNLDAGRPTRLEDATPAARFEMELQLAPVRFEQVATGVKRWRIEPKVAYGIAPFTEVEFRAPYLVVVPPDTGSPVRHGIGGVALGVMHAFTIERGPWPALALAAEWIAPMASLGAPVGSYLMKGIATRTFPAVRTHVNVAYGTYSTRLNPCAQPRPINVKPPAGCPPGPVPFDPPCDRIPGVDALCGAAAAVLPDTFDVTRSVGMRWMTAVGIDRAFALSSTLVSADIVAERFAGLFARTDVSAEIGLRRQVTPQLVVDVGVARHFNGLLRANWLSIGLGYNVPRSQ